MLISLSRVGFVIALMFGISVSASIAATLPIESEIVGIQMVCSGPGGADLLSIKGKVDAAIASWRSASANADIEAAKKNLNGAFGALIGDSQLAAVYKIYSECVKNTIQQFLDKELKPREAIIPPPATTVTYKICSGEYERACQTHDVYMYCYADVAGWAKQRCGASTVTRYTTYGGNKCGYGMDLVVCTDPH